jgi:hypothetical protein
MPIGAAIGGAGILSAGASIYGSTQAANAQTNAANQANQTIQQQYQQNSQNLAPWMQNGTNSSNLLSYLTGSGGSAPAGYSGAAGGQGALTAQFNPTQAQLESTPGYQFTLGQGLKSVQNSYAAKGLASSGAALKGAADYATGDANTTFNQQFQNYWNQNQSIYNMLSGQSGQGLSAAGALANAGTTAAGQQGQNTIGAGNAQAAMYNGIGSAIGGAANSLGTYGLLSNYMSNGTGAGGYAGQMGSTQYGGLSVPAIGYNPYG